MAIASATIDTCRLSFWKCSRCIYVEKVLLTDDKQPKIIERHKVAGGSLSVGNRNCFSLSPHCRQQLCLLPADQRVEVEVTPDAVANELLDVLAIVERWHA